MCFDNFLYAHIIWVESDIYMQCFANLQEQIPQNLKNKSLFFTPLACLKSEFKGGL